MDDMKQKHIEALNAALKAEHKVGELPDDALDAVVGGQVLTGPISLAVCNLCGWNAAFNRQGQNDIRDLAIDHIIKSQDCPGDFTIYDF